MRTLINSEAVMASETIKTIYERRAVRKFIDKPVDKAIIEKIIDAGRMAPSALNNQSWKFYILTNKKSIKAFSGEIAKIAGKEFLKIGPKQILKTVVNFLHFPHGLSFLKKQDMVFHDAPVVIFITSPKGYDWAGLDIGMCSQNIMLAAKSIGLDTCPVGFGKYVEHTKSYSKLNIPGSEEVQISIILGYGDEKPEVHKRIKKNIIFIDKE